MIVNLLITIVSFIVLLSAIVFFHELGHFKVARWCGVKVDVFSIGFGPVLFERTDKHGTKWRISALPLGGFVKFFGDAGPASMPSHDVSEDKEQAAEGGMTKFPNASEKEQLAMHLTAEEQKVCFHFKPVWQRALIVAAGPIANFILAIVIFWALLFGLGATIYKPHIAVVEEGSPAAVAGLLPGDQVVAIDGKPTKSWSDLTQAVRLGSGDELIFEVSRDGELVVLTVVPQRQDTIDRYGNTVKAGYLGVGATGEYELQRYGPIKALGAAVQNVSDVLSLTLKYLGRLFLGKEDLSQMGGPVKIAKYAGQSTMSGFDEQIPATVSLPRRLLISFIDFVQIAAMISISVGFLNLLPIPVLDGGHLVLYAYEAVAGKPLNEAIQAFSFKIGIVILLCLMVFVTWNDVTQEFFSKTAG